MRTLISFVVACCIGVSAHAQGTSRELNDDLLAHLQGTWQLKRQIRGTEVNNTVSAQWVLHHQFLEVHMQDVQVPATYEALVLIGYNPTTKKYVAHWTDTFGGEYSAIGEGVRTGNSIEFRFTYDDGPFFNTFNWLPDENRWVMRLENRLPDGKRGLFAIDTLSRP